MHKTILVVEDHKETAAMIKAALEEEGYKAACADSLRAGNHFLRTHRPCLLILDVHLPDGNGLQLCCRIRAHAELSKTPIIVLSGRDEMKDKKRGFAAGVDQYLTKPIVIDELMMWVRALLKRVEMDTRNGPLLTIGELEINTEAQILNYKDETVEDLTAREFDLLLALVKQTPRIISRKEILTEVWRTAAVENLVDTHIFNLRKKLPPELARKIQSVPGKGFRYFELG